MRILVVIASYGRKNDVYLSRVLSEYRSMPYKIQLVVVSNVKKELGPDVEVLTRLPNKNPHSLPFAHKEIFANRKDGYDLFIYSEDDILITQRNLQAFLRVTSILPAEEIAGFFRWEHYPDGKRFYPDAHLFYRWQPQSLKKAGEHAFARYTNDHSGCFALTRDQLARAIASGGFLVPPHEHMHSLLETAATDPYSQCGFTKLICLSHFDEFLVQHLPNKYIGSTLGLDAKDFDLQVEALLQPHTDTNSKDFLLEPHTRVFHSEWSKNHYEPCRHDLIALLAPKTRRVLSIGCGWGETEAELLRKGIDVTAVPLDPIIAACAQARGIKVVYGNLKGAMEQVSDLQFDCVLMSDILHLMQEPAKALEYANSVLADNGQLIATIPTFCRLPFLWKWLRHPSRYQGWKDSRQSGVHPIGRRQAKAMFQKAGVPVQRFFRTVPGRWQKVATLTRGVSDLLFSSEYIFIGRRAGTVRGTTTHSELRRSANKSAMPALQTGGRVRESICRYSGI